MNVRRLNVSHDGASWKVLVIGGELGGGMPRLPTTTLVTLRDEREVQTSLPMIFDP